MLAIGLAAWRIYRIGSVSRWLWVVGAIGASFWLLSAFNQFPGRDAASSRYVYLGAVFLLLIAAELARGVRVGRPALLAAGATTSTQRLPEPAEPSVVAVPEIDLGDDPSFRARLNELTGGWTVPQILIDDRPIGGYTELWRLDREGRLAALVTGEIDSPVTLRDVISDVVAEQG